jgi:hypothetical protein
MGNKKELSDAALASLVKEEEKRKVNLEIREALRKRAVGYEVEEIDVVAPQDGTPLKIVKRMRHIPGDPKAMLQYMSMYGDPLNP